MFEPAYFTLDDIRQQLQWLDIPFSLHGDPRPARYSFKSLRQVEGRGIYFVASDAAAVPEIADSIIICSRQGQAGAGNDNIVIAVDEPQLVFYQLMEALLDVSQCQGGIHPTAIVGAECRVDPAAWIGPYCVLENCIVEAGARLHSHVTVMGGTTIGENVTIESHSTIGATGVAWIWNPRTRRRVIQPQTGYTSIGAGSFLGTDITIVRGSVNETTRIGEGCVIAHGSKIGHGSDVGDECHFANNIAIAGNVTLGSQCFLGSGAVVRPQVRLADATVVGAGSVVVKNCEQPGCLLVGIPARPGQKTSSAMSGVPKPLVQ